MKTYKVVLAVLVCLPVLSAWAGQWTYDSESATLSHDTSGWILYASGNGTNLTVTGVGGWISGIPYALPLSDPIPGYALVSIGEGAFSGCASLASVTIPGSVTNIGDAAFSWHTGLTSVEIGSGVERIGNYAFSGCTSLTGVTIPNSVTDIGDSAFSGCTILTNVVIGSGVTSIGESAFYRCTGLTGVEIPDSVTSIGEGAFSYCTSLIDISVSATNTAYRSISGVLFNKDATLLIQYPGGREGAYSIPDGVTDIGDSAFSGRTGLTGVTIPSSVTNIGDSAFYGCTSLADVMIPDSVVSIGDGAFGDCYALTNAVIGDSVTSIGESAFYGCTGLTAVTIPGSVTSIGGGVFYGCTNLAEVMIPDSVVSIGDGAFRDCYALTNAVIGRGVASIGDWTFEGCERLTDVTIRCSEDAFGYDTFYGCDNIRRLTLDMPEISSQWQWGNAYGVNRDNVESLVIGNNVTSMHDYAFEGLTGLTSVVIPDSVTSIGYGAFSGCTILTNVVIGSGVTDIGDCAFRDCAALSRVTILCDGAAFLYEYENSSTNSNGVTNYVHGFSMKQYVFDGCVSIRELILDMPNVPQDFDSAFFKQGWYNYETGEFEIYPYGPVVSTNCVSVIFGDGTTTLEDYAFSSCIGPANLVFGSGTVNINNGFSDCDALTDIAFGSGTVNINSGFYDCDGLMNIIFGDGAVAIGDWAFQDCDGLTDIAFGSGTVNIDGGFYDCDGLMNIIFGDGAVAIGDQAFYGCDGLTEVTIPNGVTNVGCAPFQFCSFLTNISVAADNPVCRDIGGVLYSKDAATLLAFPAGRGGGYAVPSGVSRIGDVAFAGCESLAGVTFPDSVNSIGSGAFFNCGGLTNIVFGPGTADIGTGAFAYCTGLTSVAIGNAVTNIGDVAFAECYGLTDVTLPGGVTRVGDSAFCCDWPFGSMTNAVMSNVRVMGPNTFSGQPELAEVVFTATEPPRIVGAFWTQNNGVYSNWVGEAGADWEFPTWQNDGDFTVLVPAAYLNNWVADVAHPVWRGRPVRTLESAWGISGTLDFAVDDRRGLEWTTAGWFAQSAVRYSGSMALQSGDIINGQTSSVQTTVKNAGTVTFRYRVSSEEDYDFLNVYLDGALVQQDSGEGAEWRESRIVVHGTGKHKIRWDYVKDDSYSEGADCAWVDAVVWEPGTAGTEVPVPYAWLDGFGLAEGVGYEAAALADTDGDGYPAWEEYVAGTDPTDDASVLTALISLQDGMPSVTWEPDLGSARVYTVEGKASLTGGWQSPANATHRFFRVKVSMGIP